MQQMTIYVDLDDTLADYTTTKKRAIKLDPKDPHPQRHPGFFRNLPPIPDGLDTLVWMLDQGHDVFILSAPSIKNPHSYTEKRLWVEDHLGFNFVTRLILSEHKNLQRGDILIDDRISGAGQERFDGCLIQYGSTTYPDWASIRRELTAGHLL